MPIDLSDTTPRSINLTNAAGAPVDADSTPTYAITLPDLTTGTPPAVQQGATGEYYLGYPTVMAGLHRELWTAVVAGVTIVIRRFFTVEDTASVPIIDTDDAITHLRASGIITTPSDLEQLRWLCQISSEAVELDLGLVLARRSITETFDGGQQYIRLTGQPLVSVTSVVENGVTLTANTDYVADLALSVIRRGSAQSCWDFLWGNQNVTSTYVAGLATPPRVARKVALNGVQRMWQHSQQMPHPALDDASEFTIAAGVLTPLELHAYNNLRPAASS
jgi:hypothetical protein